MALLPKVGGTSTNASNTGTGTPDAAGMAKLDELYNGGNSDFNESLDIPKSDRSNLRRGVAAGTQQVQGLLYGLGGAFGDAIGSEDIAERGLEGYQRNMDEAALHQPDVEKIEDIGGVGDFADWAMYQLGTQVPNLITMAATGGVAGAAGKAAATQAVKKNLQGEITKRTAVLAGQGYAKDEAEAIATRALVKGITRKAASAGTVAAGMALQTGSIFGQIEEETGEARGGVAIGGGLISGYMEALPLFKVFDRFGVGTEHAYKNIAGRAKEIAKGGVKQAGIESITEGTQFAVEQASIAYVEENLDRFSVEMLSDLANAMAAGAVVGGTMGGAGAAVAPQKGASPQTSEADLVEQVKLISQKDPSTAKEQAAGVVENIDLSIAEIQQAAADLYVAGDNEALGNAKQQIARLKALKVDLGKKINDTDAPVAEPEATEAEKPQAQARPSNVTDPLTNPQATAENVAPAEAQGQDSTAEPYKFPDFGGLQPEASIKFLDAMNNSKKAEMIDALGMEQQYNDDGIRVFDSESIYHAVRKNADPNYSPDTKPVDSDGPDTSSVDSSNTDPTTNVQNDPPQPEPSNDVEDSVAPVEAKPDPVTETDVVSGAGTPFKNKRKAQQRINKLGKSDTHDPVEVAPNEWIGRETGAFDGLVTDADAASNAQTDVQFADTPAESQPKVTEPTETPVANDPEPASQPEPVSAEQEVATLDKLFKALPIEPKKLGFARKKNNAAIEAINQKEIKSGRSNETIEARSRAEAVGTEINRRIDQVKAKQPVTKQSAAEQFRPDTEPTQPEPKPEPVKSEKPQSTDNEADLVKQYAEALDDKSPEGKKKLSSARNELNKLQIKEGDITTDYGNPYKSAAKMQRALTVNGKKDTHEPVELSPGRWVGRPIAKKADNAKQPVEAEKPKAKKKPAAKKTAPKKAKGADNKIFTQDGYDDAIAKLKAKLGNTNSGFDPEVAALGIQVVGFHVESGVRSIAEVAAEVTAVLGEAAIPYISGWYENVRRTPGVDTEGMDSTADADEFMANYKAPVEAEVIEEAANEAATSDKNDTPKPTEAQKKTGKYKKGHLTLHELPIDIENPAGSVRDGVDAKGKEWAIKLKNHYGEFAGTEAIDGDPVDVFLTDDAGDPSLKVYVIDQIDPKTKLYDEPKVILGAQHKMDATRIYNSNYEDGWKGKGAITALSIDEFKAWVNSDAAKKPLSPRIKTKGKTNDSANSASDSVSSDPDSVGTGAAGDSSKVSKADSEKPKEREKVSSKPKASEEVPGAESKATDKEGSDEPATQPERTSPTDFHEPDLEAIASLGQVGRFERNFEALELYNELDANSQQATPEQQKILSGYIGWGAFGQELFNGDWDNPQPKKGWEARDERLREHLGQENWESAQNSIINAHYTDPKVVDAMWKMMKGFGFDGGMVLEPAMGTGNFFSFMPQDVKAKSNLVGIELDKMTAGIAQQLFPNQTVRQMGYEKSQTPDGTYDMVIGNWPFADIEITDRRYKNQKPLLHDYFFLKALDQVRPGGIVMGITSKGTMDKLNPTVRRALAEKAEFVDAIRLPGTAFKGNAGTSVVTDIIVLKKREAVEPLADDAWIQTADYKTPAGQSVTLNKHYIDNPGKVLGTIDYGTGTTSPRPGMIVNPPRDLEGALGKAVKSMPKDIYKTSNEKPRTYIKQSEGFPTGAVRSEGKDFVVSIGEFAQPLIELYDWNYPKDAKPDAKKLAPKTQARNLDQISRYVQISEKLSDLMRAENTAADNVETIRAETKALYDDFVKNHKALSKSWVVKTFMREISEPSLVSVQALEVDIGGGKVEPAMILSNQSVRRAINIENPTVGQAYAIERNSSVDVDLDRIAKAAGKKPEAVKKELIKNGAVYETANGGVIPADQYLSGNVRLRHMQLKEFMSDGKHPHLQRNLDALEKKLPKTVPYNDIEVQLGATWIDPSYYVQYIQHMLNNAPGSENSSVTWRNGRWTVDIEKPVEHAVEASTNYGHEAKKFKQLMNFAMRNQTTTVKYKDSEGNDQVDVKATQEVNERITKIRDDFEDWLWSDPDRRIPLEETYNFERNSIADASYDGSFLDMPGMALKLNPGDDSNFQLREHQQNAIWRSLVNRAGMYAHDVGTGKTFTMAGIAVEARRYGIAKKPLILAHNANSASVAADMQKMYPAGRFLYIDNLKPKTVRLKLQQIRMNDWDGIVMPHSLLPNLTLTEETYRAMAKPELDSLMAEAKEAAQADGVALDEKDILAEDDDNVKSLRSVTAKQLVKQRNRIINQIKKAGNISKENALTFEDLGVDMLLVDEVQVFKKPPISTQMQMKGLQAGTSEAAIRLYYLSQFVRDNNNGNNVHTFTGTFITNTLTELYNQMRYVMPQRMKEMAVDHWDGFFATFAQSVDDIELTSTGQYDMVTRLSAFINVPELRRIVGEYMDVVASEDMPSMQPRKTKSGKILGDATLTASEKAWIRNGRTENAKDRPYKEVINTTSKMVNDQRAVLNKLMEYAKEWENATGKERRQWMQSGDRRAPLAIENAASAAALDGRINEANAGLEGKAELHPDSKVQKALDNLLEVYRSDPNANQAVFMSRGIDPNATRSTTLANGDKVSRKIKVLSTARDIVERLVQEGVPRKEIAMITGKTSKDKRKQIADQMNRSEVRIVIGSISAMGVGVNMQKNLRAMHHLDAPWMPGDLEQANGRGERQGNQWNTVLEYRYITEKLDGKRWQILLKKNQFIQAFMKGQGSERVLDGDESQEAESSMLETFSEAAGDPRILVRTKMEKNLEKMKRKERMHLLSVNEAKGAIKKLGRDKEYVQKQLQTSNDLTPIAKSWLETMNSEPVATIGGKKYTKPKEINQAIADWRVGNAVLGGNGSIGKLGGLPLSYNWPKLAEKPSFKLTFDNGKGAKDTIETLAATAPASALKIQAKSFMEQGEKLQTGIKYLDSSIERAKETSKSKFAQQAKLDAAQVGYDQVVTDMALNPVPPPDWLRNGAPIDLKAHHDGKEITVVGHVYDEAGYYVRIQDGDKTTAVPYLEITNKVGQPVYTEHEFVPPNPEVLTDADKVPETDDVSFQSTGGKAKYKKATPAQMKRAGDWAGEIVRKRKLRKRVRLVSGVDNMPDEIKAAMRSHGFTDFEAVVNKSGIYINVARMESKAQLEEALLHEYQHKLFKDLMKEPAVSQSVKALGAEIASQGGVVKLASDQGIDLSEYQVAFDGLVSEGRITKEMANVKLMDEYMAFAAQRGVGVKGQLRDLWNRFVLALKSALRAAGFTEVTEQPADKLMSIMYAAQAANRYPTRPLDSGTSYAQSQAVPNGVSFMDRTRAWHGSANRFDKFNNDFINTGEGVQAYGWGIYLASSKAVAQHYKSALEKSKSSGALYEVELAPKQNEFLLWDKPLTKQSAHVKKAIKSLPEKVHMPDNPTGQVFVTGLYEAIQFGQWNKWAEYAGIDPTSVDNAHQIVSAVLKKSGIRGTKYLDGDSRTKQSGTFNYVIFDDNDVNITDVSFMARSKFAESGGQIDTGKGNDNAVAKESAKAPDLVNEILNSEDDDLTTSNAKKSLTQIKRKVHSLKDAARREALGGLSRRQLIEWGEKYLPRMAGYQKVADQLDADRRELQVQGARTTEKWNQLPAKDGAALAKVMQAATVAGVDPGAPEHQPLITKAEYEKKRSELNRDARAELVARRSHGMAKLNAEKRALDRLWAQEQNRLKASVPLEQAYNKLTPEAKEVYGQARDHLEGMFGEQLAAIESRVQAALGNGKKKNKVWSEIRKELEANQVQAPYFPLARFGKYWVRISTMVDQVDPVTGETIQEPLVTVDKFETLQEQKAFVEHVKANDKDTESAVTFGRDVQTLLKEHGVPTEFQTKVDNAIEDMMSDSPERDALRDTVFQLYLESLPDISARHHQQHRKLVRGFSKDAMRAFADSSFHTASLIARTRHMHKLEKNLTDLSDDVSMASKTAIVQREREALVELRDTYMGLGRVDMIGAMKKDQVEKKLRQMILKLRGDYDNADAINDRIKVLDTRLKTSEAISSDPRAKARASEYLEELTQSHERLIAPNVSPIATLANSVGFGFYLGLSPASALVNLTQVPMVTLPILGAKYGSKKASAALGQAYKDFTKKNEDGTYTMRAHLKGAEADAYDQLATRGTIDVTQAHDLAGLAEEGASYNSISHKVMGALSWSFHHAERMNREVTAMSAYRLAKESGMDQAAAIEAASDMTWRTQLDYGSTNRGRFFAGNWSRVAFQFKQYSAGITFLYTDIFRKAFGQADADTKAEARRALKGLLGIQFATTGLLGMPLSRSIGTGIEMLVNAFDEEEDFDYENTTRAALTSLLQAPLGDAMGKRAATALMKGSFDAFTPISLHGRVSLSELWLREPHKELEGRDEAAHYLKQLAGPTYGLFENILVGASLMADDNVVRGFEYMAPKFIRDTVKAGRYAVSDAQTLGGNKLADTSAIDSAVQLLGFMPSSLAARYDENSAKLGRQSKVQDRRRGLLNEVTKARANRDRVAERKAKSAIQKFNAKFAGYQITNANIKQSESSKKRTRERMDNGVNTNRKLKSLLDDFDFAP